MSITREAEPLLGLSKSDWVEYFSVYSVAFKGRVCGGNQLAASRDIKDYAGELSRYGDTEEAQRYFEQAKRLGMLGKYNYAQGTRFSLTQGRQLPNRSMRRHLGR